MGPELVHEADVMNLLKECTAMPEPQWRLAIPNPPHPLCSHPNEERAI